ncbi:MAG: hypothetical protein HDS11_04640 [Bacteroides sp.]|nr:hypothetical protein [Bacteroides sp.]
MAAMTKGERRGMIVLAIVLTLIVWLSSTDLFNVAESSTAAPAADTTGIISPSDSLSPKKHKTSRHRRAKKKNSSPRKAPLRRSPLDEPLN